jgi:phage-related tail fiber protein
MATKVTNGLDLQNQLIQNLADPSSNQDAATKAYVDAVARGLDWKASVRAASTGNVTVASAPASIDGVTLASGDRVLLKDQTTGSQNGIYTFSSAGAALVRALDADSSSEVTAGMAATVTEGTVNADRVYVLTTNDPITLGTTALAFVQVGSGGGSTYTAGNGLTESPAGTFNVGAGIGISVAADAVAIDTNVVARKFSANVGNGSLTSIAITHNLGTRDVTVEVFTNASPWDRVLCDVEHTDTNNVTLKFATAPASGAYRVVVVG